MSFPIVAFTECGLRLPLDPLFREVLYFYKLNPMQLTINSYRMINDLHQLPKNFRQSFFPGKDLKKLLGLPIHKRKAPLLLNFIPTYKSTLPDVPKKKKKSLSPPTATTQRLVDMKKEASSLKKEIKSLESKMRKLEDQAEAATKAQQMAKEKVKSAEAIRKVAEAEKKDAEVKKAQAEKELQQALATKEADVKEADEKAYTQGMADVEDESETEADAEDEDQGKNDDEALVRKPKDAAEAKSLPSAEQVMDLTLDEEGDEVGEAPKEIAIEQLSSDLLLAERKLDNTLAEIDAEIEAEKVAEDVPPESSEVPVPAAANTEES
ncbi:uncharacterized abhydrolase domain-containing protein DDB_G0269086-like [Camellia sinensis]|uniref:uncharacterized abhydrolase domain-containing protein DDB_G0269086-like n=1 Tax=Camellia sinensis TaxID=4442 RepID=UPI0010369F1B|nr:uncharacterized abhydrolase domain-containing protein DDB_G0269086-like [Camellia sinensis]